MPKTLNREEKKVVSVVDEFKKAVKVKGDIQSWQDNHLAKFRDKMRIVAKETRGAWTLDFYEALQDLNKESIKRELN
ncbi:MAG: hypothetical protein LW817_04705 [Candidatus Caenarcaniphilales bacterium]|jgi:hypothetical protein|nr:hypothetical protein [Candidatus Caenarcaniphilales bacterium]